MTAKEVWGRMSEECPYAIYGSSGELEGFVCGLHEMGKCAFESCPLLRKEEK